MGGTPPQRSPNTRANINVLAVLATMVAACVIAAPTVKTASERPGFTVGTAGSACVGAALMVRC
ncbi:hypothetical protein GCM10022251_36310 [Phytohabitans flavus]|uniref:Uncharacterized protein n=1 Tax=Phytohabitans flavus TaxID=1076124 RepID=A0A6F8XW90_9ACTN|nr:hypothetical protein Pflav_044790 [Phytohabitans flavus]